MSGADAALFEIDGSELFLVAGASLDHETNGTLDVTVEVDDAALPATPEDSAALAITVTNVNEAPTVSLANVTTTFAEDTDTTARIKVADIVVTDDALGTNALTFSGADAALFEIDGTELFLIAGASLDHETNGTLGFTVEVDDAAVADQFDRRLKRPVASLLSAGLHDPAGFLDDPHTQISSSGELGQRL